MSVLTGADVVRFRHRRGMSLDDLAATLGLERTLVDRIELYGQPIDDALEERLLLLGVIPGAPEPAASVVDIGSEMTARQVRRISNSEVQTFKRCRRKWWLAWHRGLRPRTESPVGALAIGNRIHRAMEVGYASGGPYHDRLITALERFIEEDRALLTPDTDEETLKKFSAEADLERIMLEGYVQWLEETGNDADLEVLEPEAYLEAAIPGLRGDVVMIGRIDVRVRRRSNGDILFIDHKTVAAFKDPIALLPIGEQMMHYHLLERLNAPNGENVVGALYNMLRKVKRTARATPPFYQRVEVRHNQHVIENYVTRLVGEINYILDAEERLTRGAGHQVVAFPSPSGQCTWDCQFFKVCSMFDDGSRVEDALTAHYEVGDPLSYYDRTQEEEGVNP